MKKPSSDNIRVLKTDTCHSLTGKSKITYQIGCTPDNKILFRICGNTGGGFFSGKEWIPFSAIQQILKKVPKDSPVTSIHLYPLFKGKSVNTPSFLMAALVSEALTEPLPDKKRSHKLTDPKPFLEEMKGMMSSKVAQNVAKEHAAVKKAVSKKVSKKTSSRNKKTVTKK